jgi:hypothetical protein
LEENSAPRHIQKHPRASPAVAELFQCSSHASPDVHADDVELRLDMALSESAGAVQEKVYFPR